MSCVSYRYIFFFFSSRRRHTRFDCDWSSDVCSSDLQVADSGAAPKSQLHQIVARGAARSLSHIAGAKDSAGTGPAIDYSRGKVIDIALKADKVDRIVVSGRADGVHLEPAPPKPAAADSTAKKPKPAPADSRSEEHTSELQSQSNLVCRLLLEKKKIHTQLAHHGFTPIPGD